MEVPRGLFIPPDALEVFLDTFQGPLDLLLYLIRKHNLEVLDIPMAELTRQYMAYVEIMHASQLELAAEYLLMTALLIEIKSRMLLPRPIVRANEDDVDPRAELVRRLLEYEQMKLAALRLNEMPQAERDFTLVQVLIEQTVVKRLPEINVDGLRNAWITLVARAQANRHHRVTRAELSVREHMSRIMRDLRGREFIEFYELFGPSVRMAEVVVTFLALLELVKESLVEITQSQPIGNIYVRSIDFLTAV
ncbi:MAG: segregation/condensation protein A [Nitrosomonadaceae bacterium]|nr:segregation/condensation protein A [Nitrosomonadaceae bacterium]